MSLSNAKNPNWFSLPHLGWWGTGVVGYLGVFHVHTYACELSEREREEKKTRKAVSFVQVEYN